ncbi:phosphohydrolase [Aphanothece hegewaldii CCALA 016]|uniref:bis(5'-nucleosyl)-tetraphosphatase (symmetrical) n=1 Tax=Aphanothece hegewaldii CCALA 016 TaxID=2107694 RepID=A0A2T1M0J5_9CHRO|nr:bis(5'-nucleosyl)-tetraphosphatase (symmetrical) YqeK [Aphanothece hegewaldii]PSF38194.1 phosphohydrolase [Aphanothece hegewaldii CCALA 016]
MREQVLSWLAENVSEHRLQHILGVEQMSIDLAKHHHLDYHKAGQAGLMHDLAKFFKPSRLLEMAKANHIEIDPVCAENPHLLHADVSAIVAQNEFGVTDEEILTAISNHTLGRPGMSELSCVVFVADALEPSRGNSIELETLRQQSKENLYKSVYQTCDYSLKYLLNSYLTIHPRTVLTRNWALQIVKQRS